MFFFLSPKLPFRKKKLPFRIIIEQFKKMIAFWDSQGCQLQLGYKDSFSHIFDWFFQSI